MNGKTINDIKVGDTARFTKTITQADVTLFAGITGDFNPLHIDHEHAKKTRFGQPVVHGALLVGFVSTVVGMQLPGPGALYVSQSLAFKKPVFIGDTITAEAEVVEKMDEKNRVRFATRCLDQDGEVVAEGESVLLPKKPTA
ncbi:MAG: MaoC family dehydratase [Rhodothermales bacterium]